MHLRIVSRNIVQFDVLYAGLNQQMPAALMIAGVSAWFGNYLRRLRLLSSAYVGVRHRMQAALKVYLNISALPRTHSYKRECH